MRKDADWGYFRYDMRYDPLFALKVINDHEFSNTNFIHVKWCFTGETYLAPSRTTDRFSLLG
jgi:hypothetical protein